MVQIILNLLLFGLWVVLTGALTVGVSNLAADNPAFGSLPAFGLWLLGQMIILIPMIRILWRDRRFDFEN